MATTKTIPRTALRKTPTLRFAHPFFTTTPPEARAPVPGVGKQLLAHIQQKLQPIPAAKRTPTMTLADVIGTQGETDVANSGAISFHAMGDTGRSANSPQGAIAEAMATDFNVGAPASSPAFFFHLGDVIYGPNKDVSYRPEFYEPYVHYPGKIIAIPGNHDGEIFPKTDPTTCKAFQANFCAPSQTVPPIAGTIFRQTMNQPAVYWLLDAPYVQIVGLYSNAAENPGFISGAIPGQAQKTWLLATLKTLAKQRKNGARKALVFATHHPPFSSGGHSGSTQMLSEIDGICQQAGIMPDLFLSGHAHSYQRYTRQPGSHAGLQIPYIVAGTGGINDQVIIPATGQVSGDHTFVKSLQGYGYLLVKVAGAADKKTATTLTVTMYQVDPTSQKKSQYDQVTVTLASGKVH
jgi:calcineurin-like phosphoesterase family protein